VCGRRPWWGVYALDRVPSSWTTAYLSCARVGRRARSWSRSLAVASSRRRRPPARPRRRRSSTAGDAASRPTSTTTAVREQLPSAAAAVSGHRLTSHAGMTSLVDVTRLTLHSHHASIFGSPSHRYADCKMTDTQPADLQCQCTRYSQSRNRTSIPT